MKERIAKLILGWRRLKRRMRTLIRNARPIATDPDVLNCVPVRRDDALLNLANSLRLQGAL
jgi:hypothetical protein